MELKVAGKVVLIDDEDYAIAKSWYLNINAYGYVVCYDMSTKKYAGVLHRIIMRTPEGFDTDHLNHDKLDCRKANLRICTRAENLQNNRGQKRATHGHGIRLDKRTGNYAVRLHKDGESYSTGPFKTLEEAVSGRDSLLKQLGRVFL